MLIKRILILIVVLFLVFDIYCTATTFYYVDSALTPYLDRFKHEAKIRGKSIDSSTLTLVFGETKTKLEPSTVGTCLTGTVLGLFPVVTIDTSHWTTIQEYEKEELIFHELGHCLLERDHCSVKANGLSVSIMEPDDSDLVAYLTNRDSMIDELFNPAKDCK
jgi:hypothetical protein